MDIKKLQALVIDALEDVKGQNIRIFETAHLTSLFDRVAIASGTSNRQTKSLAASVRDKVKENGGTVLSVEGENSGEWVLVDLGDMVVHIMQPAIRDYYRLEEIWGEKEIKFGAAKRTAKTAAAGDGKAVGRHLTTGTAAKKTSPRKTATKTAGASAAGKTAKPPAKRAAPAGKTVRSPATKSVKSGAAKTATKSSAKKTPAKTAAKKTPAKRGKNGA
jgi:ribosome-associated protein